MRRKQYTKRSYAEALKHPMWQRRRLEILERADFHCEWCGRGSVNLQIHHGYYDADARAPWEYDRRTLYCLCDDCHERAEQARQLIYYIVGRIHPKHHGELYHSLKTACAELENHESADDTCDPEVPSAPPLDTVTTAEE